MNRIDKRGSEVASYSEVEAAGPPAAPLGFPAPQLIYAELVPVLCYDRDKSAWVEANALIHKQHGEDVAYMLTSIVLKQTICGEVVKGVCLRRANRALGPVECISKVSEYHSNYLWEMTAEQVAVKTDRRQAMTNIHKRHTRRNPENPWKEVAALQFLGNNHPNVIHLLGAFAGKECLYEVLPFCSKGSLSSLIRQYPLGLPEETARHLFVQVLRGLRYIHSRGVCHHDISTDNILIDENGNGTTCVIIDFGMSLRVPYSYPDDPTGSTDDVTDITMIGARRRLIHSQNHCGKIRFMAPEIYQRKEGFDGYETDVWSLGVVLFVLLTGRQPYQRPEERDPGFHDLLSPHFYWNLDEAKQYVSWGHGMSEQSVDLLRKMLRPEPRERATLDWIAKHDWVKGDLTRDCPVKCQPSIDRAILNLAVK